MRSIVYFLLVCALVGCESSNPFQPSPKMIAHALTQNQEGVKQEAEKQQEKIKDMLRLPDSNRPLDRNQALNIVNNVPGVKFSRWLNRNTILIQPSADFGVSTLDKTCDALETIGDSRWAIVAVEIYNGATTSLQWQNCRLPKGEVAFGNVRPPVKW